MTRRKHRSSTAGTPGPAATRPGPQHGVRPADAASSPAAGRRPRPTAGSDLWLYGRHPVLAALANPHRRLDRLLATAETAAELAKAVACAPVPRPTPASVERRDLASVLPPDAVHQGFAALARPLAAQDLDDVADAAGPHGLLVMLDQVTDPRNIGAVLRSAQAFGAAAVVVQDRHAPEETGALAKAASGALEAVPLVRCVNLARALRGLRENGWCCVGLEGEAEGVLSRASLGGRTVLVLGAEGDGLRRLVREACDVRVRIPIAPGVDSLNLAAAAAIALHECARARDGAGGGDLPRRDTLANPGR